MSGWAAALAGLLAMFPLAEAAACTSCACGNPAITSLGTEPPLANRVRLSASLRAWASEEGTAGVDASTVRELRLDLAGSWAPNRRWSALVLLPVQARERSDVSLAKERAFGTGDLELAARFLPLIDDRMRPRWVLGLSAGVRLPTAPQIRDAGGPPLSDHAQLGGSLAALVGLSWASFFSDLVSLHAGLFGEFPLWGRDDSRGPITGRLYASLQLQPLAWLALRAGGEARAEGPRRMRGEPDENASGFAFFAAPELLLRPVSAFTLLLGARIPIGSTQATGRPGFTVMASTVVDL